MYFTGTIPNSMNQPKPMHDVMSAWTTSYCTEKCVGTAAGPYATDWQGDITPERIREAEAVCIINGVSPSPSLRDMLTGDPLVVKIDVVRALGGRRQAIRKIEQIKNLLRFQNPHAQRPTTGEFKDDPAHLVRPILNALLKQCGLAFLLGPEFSLDEIDIGYQGYLVVRVVVICIH